MSDVKSTAIAITLFNILIMLWVLIYKIDKLILILGN